MRSPKEKRLRKARKTRSQISSDFAALRNGHITLRDVLEDPESTSLGRVVVYDVLRRSPHLGKAGAKKILLTSKVWPMDRLNDISKWDRDEILKCLPPRAKPGR
jgi:hypothetical protein